MKGLPLLVSKGRDSHREFCSFYVQVGRLTSSIGATTHYQQKTPSGSGCRNGEIASLGTTDTSTMAYRYDVRWDLALSLKPLFITVSNSAPGNKALSFRCFIQYQS